MYHKHFYSRSEITTTHSLGEISEHFLAASPSSDDYVLVDVHPGQVVGAGRLVDERDVEGGLSPEVELGLTCKYDSPM